jgi:hypothetical protein
MIMLSRSALAPRPAAPEDEHAIARVADVPSQIRQEAPANDDESTAKFSFYGDPLFGMAIASVILFAVLAALVALS